MSFLQSMDLSSNNFLKFHIAYTPEHLYWFQFFQNHLDLTPTMIFLYADKVVAFFSAEQYPFSKQQWHAFISTHDQKIPHHIRILQYAEKLDELILNWYSNIKDLTINIQVEARCITIDLYPPKNLRQFVIGKGGNELEMLTHFLNSSIYGDYNYHIQLH